MSDFTILTVCTGNICRSPLAEQLVRVGLNTLPGVTVVSAGTNALVGQAMPAEAAELSRRYGADPTAHAAQQLTESQIAGAELVLAMSREHRRAVVKLHPAASRYTFTVRELARLIGDAEQSDYDELAELPAHDVGARLTRAARIAASLRGLTPPDSPDDDDVIDPYQRGAEVYELSAAQLVPAVETVVAFLNRAATARH